VPFPPRLPPRPAFVAASVALVAVSAAVGVPAPLYVVYQQTYGVSATALTGAFAVYILTLVAALLTCGTLSDHLGRRRVAVPALIVGALACLVLVQVESAVPLIAGRALQGLSIGLSLSALGALVVDLGADRPGLAGAITSGAPSGGVAVGALLSGAAVQAGGDRATLQIYAVTAAVLVASAVAVALAPETVRRSRGALRALRPRVRVPLAVRPFFAAVCLSVVAGYVLGGFTQALFPSLSAEVMGQDNRFSGALAVAVLHLAGPIAGAAAGRLAAGRAMLGGAVVLIVGVSVLAAAIAIASFPLFLVAAAVAGVGFGGGFAGAMRTVLDRCTPAERAASVAAVFLVCYLGAVVPSLLVGVIAEQWGLQPAGLAVCLLVVVLAASGAIWFRRRAPGAPDQVVRHTGGAVAQ
jgi:MFS family permease